MVERLEEGVDFGEVERGAITQIRIGEIVRVDVKASNEFAVTSVVACEVFGCSENKIGDLVEVFDGAEEGRKFGEREERSLDLEDRIINEDGAVVMITDGIIKTLIEIIIWIIVWIIIIIIIIIIWIIWDIWIWIDLIWIDWVGVMARGGIGIMTGGGVVEVGGDFKFRFDRV